MSSDMQHDATKKFEIAETWTFRDPAVASAFDHHVREQLPWYDLATGIVTHVARHYVPPGGTVVDVGASTGNVGRALASILGDRSARLIAIDNAAEMANVYDGPGQLIVEDVVDFDFAAYKPDLIVAFLVLMFVPVAERRGVIAKMMQSIQPGGAVLIFDKAQPRSGYLGNMVYRLTLAAKYEAGGATGDEIIRKELSLAGVQRPIAEAELPGFEPVFRFGDFAGWVYEAPVV